MDDDEIRDMYVARTAVERAAIEQIIAHGPESAVEPMTAAVDAMRAHIDEPNSAEMAEADMEFHRTLVELAASTRLSRLHETILVETRMCLRAMRGTYASERPASMSIRRWSTRSPTVTPRKRTR